MFRYAALLLMAVLCALAGRALARKLRDRLALLEAFSHALLRLQSEIGYTATPLVQAVRGIGVLEPFWAAFADALSRGENAEQAWRTAEGTVNMPILGEKTRNELRKLSQRLGKCTRAEETANIARTLDFLKIEMDAAKVDCAQKGKLYKGGGVLTGVALVIVLI